MFWDCGYNLQEESSAWIQATVSTETSTSLRIYIFSSSLNNFPILVLWDLVRLSIAIERELKRSYIFLFQFFFLIYCHLYNNDNVTQRGQPVPGLHQLATYVYMKFVQSLATLPKKNALRRNIHDKSRFDFRAIVCRWGGLMPHICHLVFKFTYVYNAPFQQQFATIKQKIYIYTLLSWNLFSIYNNM